MRHPPDPYSHQTILNRRLVKVFEDKGDQVDTPREIDHFAYFESQDQAEEASVALRTAGFEVDDLDPPDEDGEPWGLQFHRVDAVGGGRADEFCAEILDIVLPLEGDYDGWGAPMVQPEVN